MSVWVAVILMTFWRPDGREEFRLYSSIHRTEAACNAYVIKEQAAVQKLYPKANVSLGDTPCNRETTP